MTRFVVCLALFVSLVAVLVSAQNDLLCAYCEGLSCGPNGIGGSCGTCPAGQRCSRGRCICDRGCTGFECGPDRCGTTCGECLSTQSCVNGKCTGSCEAQCVRPDGTIRTCGWDRCTGCCGRCPTGHRCRDGVCECYPNCENKHCGPDGCGGQCGTCVGDTSFCQDSTSAFPQQCALRCGVRIIIEVREEGSERLVGQTCTLQVTGPQSFSASNVQWNQPSISLDVSDGQLGPYDFSTVCPGYENDFENHQVTADGQVVVIHVKLRTIRIEVRENPGNNLLSAASIAISGSGYSLSVNWVSPSYTWSHVGFMSYTFVTSATGYQTNTTTLAVTSSTTLIVLYLSLNGITIRVNECVDTVASVQTATITVGSQTIAYQGSAVFIPPNGFGSYTFTTASTGYITNTQTVNVQQTTQTINLCVNYAPIPVRVTSCETGNLLDGATVVTTSNTYTSYSLTFTHRSSGTTWTPVGYRGQYTFAGSFTGYSNNSLNIAVSSTTSQIAFCLNEAEFCGNGQCKGTETANHLRGGCFDCGRIRGTISLAIGQKDQLPNITVSVWSDTVNPAKFVVQNQVPPTPHFKTVSDSKGTFNIENLNFEAPRATSQTQGSYSRRFYFSLSGQFFDRTGGTDVRTDLLDLWWNYQLTNRQWSGSGSLEGTNNSPSFYFYMTPGFSTSDALVRVILSWGSRISQPGNTIQDIDLLVAGPVDDKSSKKGGVINFETKDDSSKHGTLPFAELITDSAQGNGPEVIDFYGSGNSLSIGFSSTYTSQTANVYEIWVDRPNSNQNEANSNVYVADTNAFIVLYYNDGKGVNRQGFPMDVTGVEYAYGFYNGDQWNKIPSTATMWHIIDIASGSTNVLQSIRYQGFPEGQGEVAGAKYSFASPNMEKTRSLPCGHVVSRGANPAYCPYTITYP